MLIHVKAVVQISRYVVYSRDRDKVLKPGIEKSLELWQYLQANFPVYMEMLSKSFADALQFTANTWQKIVEVTNVIIRNNLRDKIYF